MRDATSLSPERVDELLSVLTYPYCRSIIDYFRRRSTDVATTDDLVRFISEGTQQDEDGIYVAVHHATLPRLADAGVIDYDARNTTVRYRGHSTLEVWVNRIVEHGELPNATA